MIHPDTELRFISPVVGHGVIASRDIPRGTIVWVKDDFDRIYSPAVREAMDDLHREILDTYSYRNADGDFVFCWDHTRFVNHSFRPNCLPTPYGFEIAVKNIPAGAELTNDYGCLNLLKPFTPVDEGQTRQEVTPHDLAVMHGEWDREIAEALTQFPLLEQPLRPYFKDEMEEYLLSVVSGDRPTQSILDLYFQGDRKQTIAKHSGPQNAFR